MSALTRRGALSLLPLAGAAVAAPAVALAASIAATETPYQRVRRLGREFAQAMLDWDETGEQMGATILAIDVRTDREPDFFEVGSRPLLAVLLAECDAADRELCDASDGIDNVRAKQQGRTVTRADRVAWNRAFRRDRRARLRLCGFRCINMQELHEKAAAIERRWSCTELDEDEQQALLASMRLRLPKAAWGGEAVL